MLIELAPNLWHGERAFTVAGVPLTSRMTVVRLDDGGLWLHSPMMIDAALAWRGQIEQVFMAGFPLANETVFFHRASNTVIFTDIVQWWRGPLPWAGALYAHLTGVRRALAMPRTVRLRSSR